MFRGSFMSNRKGFSTALYRVLLASLGLLLAAVPAALGDRVKLKDGRVIEGLVITQGSGYWVKATDGTTYKLEGSEVASVERGTGSAPVPGAAPSLTKPGAKAPVVVNFNATRSKCATVDNALTAVAHWQQFVDNAPKDNPDLPAAKEELAKWKALADGGAEKIKGKWVSGDERKAIVAKAGALQKEADRLIQKNQTLQAVKKLEESAALYPNSLETNFTLGYIAMIQHSEDKALDWFNKALAVRPDTPEAMGNIALIHCSKRQWDKGILLMKRALDIGDRPEIVNNLIVAITQAPDALRRRKDIKEAEEAARLLASRHDGSKFTGGYIIVPLRNRRGASDDGSAMPGGAMWNGTGFVVSADGLILTNRHVVEGGKTLMVVMQGAGPGGKALQKSAEVVVVDDEQDLALVRIKPEPGKPYTVVTLSPKDSPADGAECTVIGYPMIDRLGADVKVTRGIVSAGSRREAPDVMIDAKVNPGNSGGPILDRYGNVMAIVSMKTVGQNQSEDNYGLGISAGQIRRFLTKNSVKLTPGPAAGTALSAEDVAAKVKPGTVCILGTSK